MQGIKLKTVASGWFFKEINDLKMRRSMYPKTILKSINLAHDEEIKYGLCGAYVNIEDFNKWRQCAPSFSDALLIPIARLKEPRGIKAGYLLITNKRLIFAEPLDLNGKFSLSEDVNFNIRESYNLNNIINYNILKSFDGKQDPVISILIKISEKTIERKLCKHITYNIHFSHEEAKEFVNTLKENIANYNLKNTIPPKPCPGCNHGLLFVENYQKWYCETCNKYYD